MAHDSQALLAQILDYSTCYLVTYSLVINLNKPPVSDIPATLEYCILLQQGYLNRLEAHRCVSARRDCAVLSSASLSAASLSSRSEACRDVSFSSVLASDRSACSCDLCPASCMAVTQGWNVGNQLSHGACVCAVTSLY